MVFDVKTLALANLGIQIFLIVFVLQAVYSVKKGNPLKHCAMVRIAVPIQILAIIAVMLPSLLGYIKSESFGILFNVEILIHHTLGLLVVVLWIYINLAFGNIIRMPGNFRMFMRTALGLWLLALVLGLHIYTRLYV
jgi:putative membrane protein